MLALTHVPSPRLVDGERTHIDRAPIDYALALRQHEDYRAMLLACGVRVRLLDVNRDLPDGTFIEDAAIVLDELAVLASMGAQSRRDELPGIAAELERYRLLQRIELPATIEGGDVVRVGRTLLVGLSSRTNRAGIEALRAIVAPYAYRVVPVTLRNCLHLKSACTALPDDSLFVNPHWLDVDSLERFKLINVPEEEPWSAGTLAVSGTVCLASENRHAADLLTRCGYDVKTLPLSEFAKAEGCVTCLSILLKD